MQINKIKYIKTSFKYNIYIKHANIIFKTKPTSILFN